MQRTPLHGADARFARHGGWWRFLGSRLGLAEDAGEQQIPCGNDNQKSKSKNKSNGCGGADDWDSRFPAGMTTRKAKARTNAKAGVGLTTDG